MPVTVGVKVVLWPPMTDTVAGARLRPTTAVGLSEMVAVADLVESTVLAAFNVTVWALLIVAGAV